MFKLKSEKIILENMIRFNRLLDEIPVVFF